MKNTLFISILFIGIAFYSVDSFAQINIQKHQVHKMTGNQLMSTPLKAINNKSLCDMTSIYFIIVDDINHMKKNNKKIAYSLYKPYLSSHLYNELKSEKARAFFIKDSCSSKRIKVNTWQVRVKGTNFTKNSLGKYNNKKVIYHFIIKRSSNHVQDNYSGLILVSYTKHN